MTNKGDGKGEMRGGPSTSLKTGSSTSLRSGRDDGICGTKELGPVGEEGGVLVGLALLLRGFLLIALVGVLLRAFVAAEADDAVFVVVAEEGGGSVGELVADAFGFLFGFGAGGGVEGA